MGKKGFIDRKHAQRFRLIPASAVQADEPTEVFQPSKEHIEEQRKYGVFFDDNYDYMQHLRDRNEANVMLSLDEVRSVVRAPHMPEMESNEKKVVFDDDLDKALEGDFEESGDLEDDFIEMAGGVVEDKLLVPRMRRPIMEEDDSDYEDDDNEDFNRGYEDYDMEDEEESDEEEHGHDEGDRDVDAAFEAMLEADYNEDQLGELEGEVVEINGIEPTDVRVRKLVGEKRGVPEYDVEFAKKYVRDHMKQIEKEGKDDMEEVEIDVSASKRMKWDCESFATQYSNCYNHPSLIKEKGGRLSRKALRELEKKSEIVVEEEDEDMEDNDEDDESICTTTTYRPRGETTEERKIRKGAIKEQRKIRRAEKKENKNAFAIEHRKAVQSRFANQKTTPIV